MLSYISSYLASCPGTNALSRSTPGGSRGGSQALSPEAELWQVGDETRHPSAPATHCPSRPWLSYGFCVLHVRCLSHPHLLYLILKSLFYVHGP